VRYAPARWVGIDEVGGVDFGGDAWGGLNDGTRTCIGCDGREG